MKALHTYIDRCLIDEYVTKHPEDGLSLFVSDLPKHEIENLLTRMMDENTSVKDLVLDEMQKLINERLSVIESDHSYWRKSA